MSDLAAAAPVPLVKSRQRVSDHGEVFTPPWLVKTRLDVGKLTTGVTVPQWSSILMLSNLKFMQEIAEDIAASPRRGPPDAPDAVRTILQGWGYPEECVDRAVTGVVGLVGVSEGARRALTGYGPGRTKPYVKAASMVN